MTLKSQTRFKDSNSYMCLTYPVLPDMRHLSVAVKLVPPSTGCPGDRWPSTGSAPPWPPSSAWCEALLRAHRTCDTRRTCTGRRPARWWAGWPNSPPSPLHPYLRQFYLVCLCHSAACRWSSPVHLQGAAKDRVRSGCVLRWRAPDSVETHYCRCVDSFKYSISPSFQIKTLKNAKIQPFNAVFCTFWMKIGVNITDIKLHIPPKTSNSRTLQGFYKGLNLSMLQEKTWLDIAEGSFFTCDLVKSRNQGETIHFTAAAVSTKTSITGGLNGEKAREQRHTDESECCIL